jgi:hypothetical protein
VVNRDDKRADVDKSWVIATCDRNREEIDMKLSHVAPLAIAAAAAAVALAPIALADVDVQQHPGNAQVTTSPGAAAHEAAQNQQPFGGNPNALIFHH